LKRLILFITLISYSTSYSQNSFTLSGYVTEEETGESLIGVSVFDEKSLKGTTTNQYGFYSLTLESGTYSIQYSFIGLKTFSKTINLNEDKRVNISLKDNSIKTEEVTVKGEKSDKNVESTNMSQVKLQVSNIKKLPVILGEVDVLKSAQLLPGIQSGGEGNSALYVRGGGPDQNLILLDEAVVYNASH
tara:strand:+ start:130 stop:696 length:567 start_codon:yes stop_codon:yes gene_type:complete